MTIFRHSALYFATPIFWTSSGPYYVRMAKQIHVFLVKVVKCTAHNNLQLFPCITHVIIPTTTENHARHTHTYIHTCTLDIIYLDSKCLVNLVFDR